MSSFAMFNQPSELKRLEEEKKKEIVYYGEAIGDEEEAESVWKSILKRKGLPLDTEYEFVDSFDKAYDESYCDMLYQTIEEKKKNPEAAESWGRSTFEWLPPPAPPSLDFSSSFTYVCDFDERKSEHKVCGDINAILYPRGSGDGWKRYCLSRESYNMNGVKFMELQAKGIIPSGLVRLPMHQYADYDLHLPVMPEYE